MESVGLDVGTNWTRASLFSVTGRLLLHQTSRTAPLHSPAKGFVEINPESVFRNTCNVLRQLLTRTSKDDIVLSLSCMAPVIVFLDDEWRCLGNAILYNDTRSSKEADEINAELGEDKMLDINGNVCNIQQWLPKIRWMKKNRPSTMQKIAHIMDLSSYLVYRFCGENVIDLTIAQEAGLLDFRKKKWSDEILSNMDLNEMMLPELRGTCEIVGDMRKRTADSMNSSSTRRRIVMNSGCVDAVASSVSAGAVRENTAAVVLGSTGIISYSTAQPKVDKRLYLDICPVQGLYYLGGGTASAGIFLDYISDMLLGDLSNSKYIEKLVSSSPPGSKGLLMLPYILGERTPLLDPDAKGAIFGISATHRKADFVRAAVEGVGYSILDHFRVLSELGYFPSTVKLTGGAARSRTWRQILADMMGIPMIYNEKISGAMGAAFIGYVSAGAITDWNKVDGWISGWNTHTPIPELTAMYRRYFESYRATYRLTRETMKFLNNHKHAGTAD